MIIDEVSLYTATLQFLARKNILVPEDISMICTDSDRCFEWCHQKVAHIAWDINPLVRRIRRWAENVSHGKVDIRQSFTHARFIPGDTIGPVRKQLDVKW
jgi:DNA-binding LacI/PurR family transcriptional regulator